MKVYISKLVAPPDHAWLTLTAPRPTGHGAVYRSRMFLGRRVKLSVKGQSMASVKLTASGGLVVKLSSNDTHDWAHLAGDSWPCSRLSGRRVVAEYDSRGDLVDLMIDGGRGDQDVDGNEFDAITSDYIAAKFPNHPAVR